MEELTIWQGRIWADTKEEAARKAREKHPDCRDILSVKATHIPRWWEYTIGKSLKESDEVDI